MLLMSCINKQLRLSSGCCTKFKEDFMSVENLTRYDCKVIDAGTHQYTDMVPCCHGGYVKYEDVVETSSNSVQQLNAEISAMISKWKHCCKLGVDWYEVELSDYERLQKLSAV